MNTWCTINNKGEVGCHDCDKLRAEDDLAIRQKEYPEEDWEMFSTSDED